MSLRVWNGSSWVPAVGVRVWNGSAWTPVDGGYTWNGSAWTQFYPTKMVSITDETASDLSKAGIGGTGVATYQLNSDGQAYRSVFSATPLVAIIGEWQLTGSASDYEVFATFSGSGGTVSGPTGSWVSLGTTRDWTLSVTNNFVTRDLAVQIRLASTGTVIDTATITLEVDSAP